MEITKEERLHQYDKEHLMFGMMFVLGNKLQVLGDSFYEEITSKQWFVLVMLELIGEHPTINELSDAMGSSHQNVKQLVLKLEAKGYVQLYTDDKDRRKTRIRRTHKCSELVTKYQKKEQEFMELLYQGIEKQKIKTAVEVLLQFEMNMDRIMDPSVK